MKVREFNFPDTTTTATAQHAPACPGWGALDWSGTSVIGKKMGRKLGQTTPGYFELLKSGSVIPATEYHRWDSSSSGQYSLTRQWNYGTCSGGAPAITTEYRNGFGYRTSLHTPASAQADISRLAKQIDEMALLQAAVADTLPDLDASTTLLELPKTLKMVKDVRADVRSLIIEALRGGKHTAKAAAQAWLVWKYGWQQAMRDCDNIADLINHPRLDFKTSSKSDSVSDTSLESFTIFSDDYSEALGQADVSHTLDVIAHAYRRPHASTVNAVWSGFVSLWELIPYSFVADWFISVGDCLKAWIAMIDSDLVTSIGYKYTLDETSSCVSSNSKAPLCTSVSCSAAGSRKLTYKWRIPRAVSLTPRLRVNLTTSRCIDAASLLAKRII